LAIAAVIGIIAPSTPNSVQGQSSIMVGGDAAFRSRYEWRALTRRNAWVLQPDMFVAFGWSSGFLTLGGWTSIELSPASQTDAGTIGLGSGLGEGNVWAEWAGWSGSFDYAVGYTTYFFDVDEAASVGSAVFNTHELYAEGQLRVGPLAAKTAFWLDVDEVKGTYAELSATYRLPVLPVAIPVLYLRILGGFSAGQAVNDDDPSEGAYFVENGLTHLELSATTQVYFPLGVLSQAYLTPSVQFQINKDAATRRSSRGVPASQRSTTWVWSIALSLPVRIKTFGA
jgi:hypothetical protein